MTWTTTVVPACPETPAQAPAECPGCSRPAALAHNLRNLISGLGLVAEELQAADDARCRELGRRVDVALTRAIRLCHEAEGRLPMAMPAGLAKGVPLATILGDAALVARTMAARGTAVVSRIDDSLSPASLAPRHADVLFLTMMNLVWNAVAAVNAAGPGRVSIRLSRTQRGFGIRVEDTGLGLPASVLAWLAPFLRNHQVPPGREASGLVIAASSARQLGGRITLLRSNAAGTQFEITLPAALVAAPALG